MKHESCHQDSPRNQGGLWNPLHAALWGVAVWAGALRGDRGVPVSARSRDMCVGSPPFRVKAQGKEYIRFVRTPRQVTATGPARHLASTLQRQCTGVQDRAPSRNSTVYTAEHDASALLQLQSQPCRSSYWPCAWVAPEVSLH